MHFDVVIVGYRLNAKEPAAKALERILGMDPETARRLARNFPATVRSHLSADKAEDLREDLSEAGALVELHAEKPTALHKKPEPAAAPPAAGRRSLATSDKSSLAPVPRTDKGAPPPTPAAALANYQLGDFGLAGARASGASMRPSLPLNVPPPPPAGPSLAGLPTTGLAPRTAAGRRASITNGMLDLDLSAGLPLELDQPADSFSGRGSRTGSTQTGSAPSNDLHSLGERFSDTATPGRGPQVEERAYRSIQRAPRSLDSRRPGASRRPPKKTLLHVLREWIPSTLMLLALSAGSVAAVDFGLESDDSLGALLREHASAFASPAARASGNDGSNLHPLLRMTPAAARGPLAIILRSRITGVHEVEVIYKGRPNDFHCAVVEQAEGETETRLAHVRETGTEVPVPSEVGAQLRERESSLRSESKHPELKFTEICLTL